MPATPIATTTVPRQTATATSRACLAAAGVAIAVAACGGGGGAAFTWLHPKTPPASWQVVRVASGGELAYPPGWRRVSGDRGTATAVLFGADGTYLGYLNLTPRQGSETLSSWASFRVEHNGEEGDRAVKRLAAATGLHFLTGHGSCVRDSYTTKTRARYTEIACLVAGTRTDSVIVGAAPPGNWGRLSGVLERAIEGVRT